MTAVIRYEKGKCVSNLDYYFIGRYFGFTVSQITRIMVTADGHRDSPSFSPELRSAMLDAVGIQEDSTIDHTKSKAPTETNDARPMGT